MNKYTDNMKLRYGEVHPGQQFMFMGKELTKQNDYWAVDEAGKKYFMSRRDQVQPKPLDIESN